MEVPCHLWASVPDSTIVEGIILLQSHSMPSTDLHHLYLEMFYNMKDSID